MKILYIICVAVCFVCLQICLGQTSGGQSFYIKPKQENHQVLGATNPYNKTDIPNLNGNFMNMANHLNQKKLSILQSANRISDLVNQPSKAVLENRQNNIFPSFPQQQTLQELPNIPQLQSSVQQKNNLEAPVQPNLSLGCLNLLQNQNANTIQAFPSEPMPNSNILPAPNIISAAEYLQPLQNNNLVIPAVMPSLVSPSMTVTTSLSPSIIPTDKTPKVYVQKLSKIQDSSVISPKKVFVALREVPISQPMIPTYLPNVEDNSEKSLNIKTILPLILNLMTEKEACTSCSRCNCCCNNNNINEAAQIDSRYSRHRQYGPSSEEIEEDASEELTRMLVKRIKNKIYRAKRRFKYQKNNILSDEEYDESQSDEDY